MKLPGSPRTSAMKILSYPTFNGLHEGVNRPRSVLISVLEDSADFHRCPAMIIMPLRLMLVLV
jgi:hypothetical protein